MLICDRFGGAMNRPDLCLIDDRQPAGFPRSVPPGYRPRHARDLDESTDVTDTLKRPRDIPGRHATTVKPLTESEIRVFRLLRGSLSLRQIAAELFLSINTIKTHTQSIYRKLGVSTRDDAIVRGRDTGIL